MLQNFTLYQKEENVTLCEIWQAVVGQWVTEENTGHILIIHIQI